MRSYLIIGVLLAVGLLSACGGGSPLVPEPGPFVGVFTVDSIDVGTFTFTTNPGAIQGSGTIWLDEIAYQVTVVGLITDGAIDGNLDSADERTEFDGKFLNRQRATGTFSFEVAAGEAMGYWTAAIPSGDA